MHTTSSVQFSKKPKQVVNGNCCKPVLIGCTTPAPTCHTHTHTHSDASPGCNLIRLAQKRVVRTHRLIIVLKQLTIHCVCAATRRFYGPTCRQKWTQAQFLLMPSSPISITHRRALARLPGERSSPGRMERRARTLSVTREDVGETRACATFITSQINVFDFPACVKYIKPLL